MPQGSGQAALVSNHTPHTHTPCHECPSTKLGRLRRYCPCKIEKSEKKRFLTHNTPCCSQCHRAQGKLPWSQTTHHTRTHLAMNVHQPSLGGSGGIAPAKLRKVRKNGF